MPDRALSHIDRIRLLVLDVDGVLTDGGVMLDAKGDEVKRFHVHDGAAIEWWRQCGHRVAILSGRTSAAVTYRARELGIETVLQGVSDKLGRFRELCRDLGVEPAQVCFVGDDLADLPVMLAAGLGVAPSNACAEVKEAAGLVTRRAGGSGANTGRRSCGARGCP